MCKTTIYLEVPSDIHDQFAQAQLSMNVLLQEAGVDGAIRHVEAPYSEQVSSRFKSVVMELLVGSVSVWVIAQAVQQILHTYLRRPRIIEIATLEEVRDGNDNPIRDASGKPVLYLARRFQLLDPGQGKGSQVLELSLSRSVVIRIKSDNEH